jgi:hypothetical protein
LQLHNAIFTNFELGDNMTILLQFLNI